MKKAWKQMNKSENRGKNNLQSRYFQKKMARSDAAAKKYRVTGLQAR